MEIYVAACVIIIRDIKNGPTQDKSKVLSAESGLIFRPAKYT